MTGLEFSVSGLPPAKSEAKSMMAEGHPHASRVSALLTAARAAGARHGDGGFGPRLVGLDLVLRTVAADPPSDATNYLGGVGDVLERKSHRQGVDHLGDLFDVALFDNDRQIRDVRLRHERAETNGYTVRVWEL